jgi:hypothetical protein
MLHIAASFVAKLAARDVIVVRTMRHCQSDLTLEKFRDMHGLGAHAMAGAYYNSSNERARAAVAGVFHHRQGQSLAIQHTIPL